MNLCSLFFFLFPFCIVGKVVMCDSRMYSSTMLVLVLYCAPYMSCHASSLTSAHILVYALKS
ncbi:hypothetical protein B9Z19DRAFT_580869 [Tuber borchii]|uniref:Uncharacterized protein n=1 Tax=Tuber borchii TaxID=42251 RepID=A0A2T7A1K0_TUBBO|nr:hypothetical protein B9Z19DRAFT_580869 [Tuber borchii]